MSSPSDIPRRRIEEFVALYELESELVDFFVEGRSDRVLFEHLLDGSHENIRVWEADEIDIPADLIAGTGENIGAKGRIVGLAKEFDDRLDAGKEYSIMCIVDADFDHIIEKPKNRSRFLAQTDFSCIESYYWNSNVVRKYFRFSLHDSPSVKVPEFMARVESAMREMFLLRLAVESLGLRFSWIDPTACCGDSRKGGRFDQVDYLVRLLNKNSGKSSRAELELRVEYFRNRLNEDPRHAMHGHDLCKFMAWILRPHVKDRNLTAEEVISRSLAGCIESEAIAAYPLFSRVLQLARLC
ncbi:DUF4435 domain-containing protein [Streptomyces niveus]|uniref:DUF4435 domain-containing protein n=1 Tax=Streptomyces niveus TaxID=193462 RepID=UPI0033A3B3EB